MNLKEYKELGRSTANLLKKAIVRAEKSIDVYLDEEQGAQAGFTADLVKHVTNAGVEAEGQLQRMELDTKTSNTQIQNSFNNLEMGAEVESSLTRVYTSLENLEQEANEKASAEIAELDSQISRIEAIYEYGCVSTVEIIVNELPISPIGIAAMEQDFLADLDAIHKNLQKLEEQHAAYTQKLAQLEESGAPQSEIDEIRAMLDQNDVDREVLHTEMAQKEDEWRTTQDDWRADNELLIEEVENRKQEHSGFNFIGAFQK